MKRLAAAVVVLLALASPATAHVQKEHDPDDVRGRLDIKRISLAHDGFEYVFEVKTHQTWSGKVIKGVNGGINIYIDSAGDDRLNYYIVFSKTRQGIQCLMYNRKAEQKAEGEAKKLAGDTVNCTIRQGAIRRDSRNFKWAAQTSWQLSKDEYEFDYAPNEGYLKHRIPI